LRAVVFTLRSRPFVPAGLHATTNTQGSARLLLFGATTARLVDGLHYRMKLIAAAPEVRIVAAVR
jgi:hypothetical protein